MNTGIRFVKGQFILNTGIRFVKGQFILNTMIRFDKKMQFAILNARGTHRCIEMQCIQTSVDVQCVKKTIIYFLWVHRRCTITPLKVDLFRTGGVQVFPRFSEEDSPQGNGSAARDRIQSDRGGG